MNESFKTKATFILDRRAFAPARKSYQIGLLTTHKNGDFGAISRLAAPGSPRMTRRLIVAVYTITDDFRRVVPTRRKLSVMVRAYRLNFDWLSVVIFPMQLSDEHKCKLWLQRLTRKRSAQVLGKEIVKTLF